MSLAACAAVPVRSVMKPILIGGRWAHTGSGATPRKNTSTAPISIGNLVLLMTLSPPLGRATSPRARERRRQLRSPPSRAPLPRVGLDQRYAEVDDEREGGQIEHPVDLAAFADD